MVDTGAYDAVKEGKSEHFTDEVPKTIGVHPVEGEYA